MVDDRPHAFGDRLILQVNAVNSAVNGAVLLSDAVDLPVIGRFASSRPRPSQSDVLGRYLLPRPVPPIGVPSRNAGCGSDIADTASFHHKNTNIV